VLLVVASGAVLLGTLYPLIIDALGLGKLSVGPPYFNSVFVPLMVPLFFLMAAGPVARWKHAAVADIAKRLKWGFAVALVLGIALPFLRDTWSPLAALGILLAVWIASSSVIQIYDRLKSGRPPRAYWGMHLAHIGVAISIIGITMVKNYEVERDVRMAPGDTVTVGGYTIRFKGVGDVPGPNYRAVRGDMELLKDGNVLRLMNPEKRNYFSSSMPMTEAAIDPGLARDVYVSLGDPLDGGDGAWSVRVYYKPFVDWIWGGAFLMALGGVLAASDRRYRLKSRAFSESGLAAQGATA
jgi:cytochrome c-type biogenesis protein CcmF